MTYNHEPRRHFSKKQREEFIRRHNHICWWCKESIADGQVWHIEHVIAREMMEGPEADDDANLRPIHAVPCHREKSAIDASRIAKSNRIRRENGPIEQRRKTKPIPSRPMQSGGQKIPSRPFQQRKTT